MTLASGEGGVHGSQCGAYVGEVEEIMCIVYVSVTEGV